MINIQSPLLMGAMLGLALGLSTTIPQEEKLRHAFAYLFGGMAIASIGGGLYFFSETQLQFLSQFLFSFLLVFLVTFPLGLRYRRWRYGSGIAIIESTHIPNEYEAREILSRMPKIEAQIEGKGNIIFGFKVVVMFTIQNTAKVVLDDLDATLTVRDLYLKREEKFVCKELSDMFPNEKLNYTLEAKVGRRWWNMNVIFKVRRRKVVLEEIHGTFSRTLKNS